MKKTLCTILFIAASVTAAEAGPTQTGATGLLTVPSADTLDTGNISVGLWSNYALNSVGKDSFIIPATITLGLGSFIEAYGTYPNLLFNGSEDYSGRSSVDIGGKIRFLGKRNSPFKMAVDVSAHRRISDREATITDVAGHVIKRVLVDDGTTDVGTRLVASLRLGEKVAFHAYGGYRFSGDSKDVVDDEVVTVKHENQLLYGGAVEFAPAARMKLTGELTGNTSREKHGDGNLEALIGFQYYVTPHLTLNLGGGLGMIGPTDYRMIAGFTSSQGIGTYIRAVPKVAGAQDVQLKKQDQIKPVKIVPISRFMTSTATITPQASKLEVPQDAEREEVVIRPYAQIGLAQSAPESGTRQAKAVFPTLPEGDSARPGAKASSGSELEGTTQLYGIDMKDDRIQVASAKIASTPEVMKVYRRFRFPDISFDYNQWDISAEGKKFLAEVADQIRNDKNWVYLRIDGHTDDIGSMAYNKDLSLSRAISVANYLVTKEGISPERIFVKGMGKTKPISDNASIEGKRLNRRCEILFLVPKASQ